MINSLAVLNNEYAILLPLYLEIPISACIEYKLRNRQRCLLEFYITLINLTLIELLVCKLSYRVNQNNFSLHFMSKRNPIANVLFYEYTVSLRFSSKTRRGAERMNFVLDSPFKNMYCELVSCLTPYGLRSLAQDLLPHTLQGWYVQYACSILDRSGKAFLNPSVVYMKLKLHMYVSKEKGTQIKSIPSTILCHILIVSKQEQQYYHRPRGFRTFLKSMSEGRLKATSTHMPCHLCPIYRRKHIAWTNTLNALESAA